MVFSLHPVKLVVTCVCVMSLVSCMIFLWAIASKRTPCSLDCHMSTYGWLLCKRVDDVLGNMHYTAVLVLPCSTLLSCIGHMSNVNANICGLCKCGLLWWPEV